jgi:hypothetical protein
MGRTTAHAAAAANFKRYRSIWLNFKLLQAFQLRIISRVAAEMIYKIRERHKSHSTTHNSIKTEYK